MVGGRPRKSVVLSVSLFLGDPRPKGFKRVTNAVLYLAARDKVMGLDNPDLINRTVMRRDAQRDRGR